MSLGVVGLLALSVGLLRCVVAKDGERVSFFAGLFLLHTLLAWMYASYTINDQRSDALRYFNSDVGSLRAGSDLLFFIVPRMAGWTGASFLDLTLVFATVGFIGIQMFSLAGEALAARYHLDGKPIRRRIWLLLSLPGLHFWSTGIGKDALIVFALGYVAMGVASRQRWPVVVGALITLAVRPHILVILGVSVVISQSLTRGGSVVKKIVIGVVAAAATWYAATITLSLMGIEAVSVEALQDDLQGRTAENAAGGGVVAGGYVARIFAYLFRPLFFDAQGLFGAVASVENVILLLVVVSSVARLVRIDRRELRQRPELLFFLAFFLLGVCTLAFGLSNVGIALRQKYMFLPFMFIAASIMEGLANKGVGSLARVRPRA